MMLVLATVLFLVLLAAWAAAWRSNPAMALGIGIGILMGWLAAGMAGRIHLDEIPIWLPPLPFAVVAATLIIFGVLVWLRADQPDDSPSPRS
jgi:hypothetical protein